MTRLTRNEGHVILAGIRVFAHLHERSPTPAELADLLELAETTVRLRLAALADLGAVAVVDSAFETHAEVRDHLAVEALSAEDGPAISEDLRAFDARKREEADRMSHLFESGEHEEEQRQKIRRMDADLKDFRRRKPQNPFGED